MIDLITHAPIKVSADGDGGPYIMVPLDQLESLTSILRMNRISFWEDTSAISLNGKPELIVVNFGRGVNAAHIQRLLDAAA